MEAHVQGETADVAEWGAIEWGSCEGHCVKKCAARKNIMRSSQNNDDAVNNGV